MLKTAALPHSITEQIIRRAGGNPFFIEEVVRSLIDQGAILLKQGRFEVTEKVSEIPIPNTINDVLMARIDRLEEKTRHLVKVASVIGRNFFFRILSHVASEVEDIPNKLSFLSEIQILQSQERMGEVEYLFKHALAQEAAYDSILPPKRKELHLKVAHSIEKIFSERLPEFYGMLAYHYSRAEDLEKTEEFLIKAGEEALRSAASDEALHYYKEALRLYLKKSGNDADPEKVAMLEKNIALALYNRGQHQEAIKHFDRALGHYWGKLPQNGVWVAAKVLSAFAHFLVALYLPFLKFRKTPTERDIEIVDLFFKKCKSLAIIDAKNFFIQTLLLFKFMSSFDISKFADGKGIFVTLSALFSFSGISFKLSKRVLDVVKRSVSKDDIRSYTKYEIADAMHKFLGGHWKELKDFDYSLVEKSCGIGEIWDASNYLYWRVLGKIWQGSFEEARPMVKRLDHLFETYGNDLSRIYKYETNTSLLIESGKLDDATIESEKGIAFGEKAFSFWDLHVSQAWMHIAKGATQKAQECLGRADSIRLETQRTPFQLAPHFKTQFGLDLYIFDKVTKDRNRAEVENLRRKAFRSGKLLKNISRKVAYHRTDSYRLLGTSYWAINKQKKAFRWWHRAVQEGEYLGARPELARLYSEIGKCLLESNGKYTKLDGLKGEQYLEKARTLFEEMRLEPAG